METPGVQARLADLDAIGEEVAKRHLLIEVRSDKLESVMEALAVADFGAQAKGRTLDLVELELDGHDLTLGKLAGDNSAESGFAKDVAAAIQHPILTLA